jgi:hypothetical protein
MDSLAHRVAARFAHEIRAWGRSITLPRDQQIPADAGKPLEPEGTDLAIYTWDDESPYTHKKRFWGAAFTGKSNKAIWFTQFATQSNRIEEIRKTIERRKEQLAAKERARQQKADFQHNVKVGDIFYCSWGYDQTNIDFYQVTQVKGKNVVIREIGKVSPGGDVTSERVVADPNEFVGPPMLKRLQQAGGGDRVYIKVHSFANAYPWDGHALHQTNSLYGH